MSSRCHGADLGGGSSPVTSARSGSGTPQRLSSPAERWRLRVSRSPSGISVPRSRRRSPCSSHTLHTSGRGLQAGQSA
ncbi:MAG: hypothetical protein LUF84_03925 [Clostridiales bacterium]|nr:hypothetical protein [Clostridiales bacterium]